jgi:hypothetical protein
MQVPDPIETILARLMPPALSEDCQADLEEMLTHLAGTPPENLVAISSGKWLVRSLIGGGIAAAIGAMCAIYPLNQRSAQDPVVQAPDSAPADGFILVSESDRIESVTDEGWRKDSEGAAMHAVRLKTVQENRVRDEKSGMVVQISEPREEILMMPASSDQGGLMLKKPKAGPLVEAASFPAETCSPVRVVNVAEKSAYFTSPTEGRAEVSREEGIYHVKICGLAGEVVFQGAFSKEDLLEKPPEIWRTKLQVLCRTLDQALDGDMIPRRQPQPRVTPSAPSPP